ncbi:MAG: acetyl-CoA carboxylase biotin carboxyl carrier protein [Planctomycetota bacterium]|jgi:acetyl-CoA carboxylase biotin carboxyl carrier protein
MDDVNKIKELVELMQDFDLIEIEIKEGDREIKLKKAGGNSQVPMAPMAMAANPVMAPAPLPQAGGEAAADAPPARDPNITEFKSPMVGTFYRAPSPESPPYVTEGDRITNDTILCIVEAMKVMNEIKAEMQGEVTEILVENGEAIEFGQPLFLVRRAG